MAFSGLSTPPHTPDIPGVQGPQGKARVILRQRDLRDIASRVLGGVGYCLDCGLCLLPGTEGAVQVPHVVTVYFHGVLDEPVDGFLDPQEGMNPAFLREFIRLMKAAGYTFVTPDAMLNPNTPRGNLVILSSDDGYHSVQRLLPILEEQAVPLTVFLTTEYSRRDGIYWWDQIYAAGYSRSRTKSLLKHDVRSRAERDEALRHLGIDPDATAFRESHRLLSPEDVGRLAKHPRLSFGNHTRNHLSLPLLEDGRVQEEVEAARQDIEAWTGKIVRHFAFPYGDYDERTLHILQRCGFRTAFTTEPGHFLLPSEPPGTLGIPRYRLRADRSAKWQTRIMTKGITLGSKVEAGLRNWMRGILGLQRGVQGKK